jgi:hypothetical protein
MISNAQLGRAVLELATDSATFYADLSKAEARMASLKGEVAKAGGSFAGFGQDVDKAGTNVGASFLKMSSAVALGTAAFHLLETGGRAAFGFLKSTVEAATEAEDSMSRLTTAMKAQGTATPALIAGYRQMSAEFQHTTTYSHDAIENVMGVLIQLGNVAPANMRKALEAVTNLAAGLPGKDIEQVAQAVGKALGGNTTALSKLIPEIKAAGAEAKTAEGLLRILSESGFGGQAAAAATTYAGRIKRIGNEWMDLKETLGDAIVRNQTVRDAMGMVTDALIEQTGNLSHNRVGFELVSGAVIFLVRGMAAVVSASGSVMSIGSSLKVIFGDLAQIVLGAAFAFEETALGIAHVLHFTTFGKAFGDDVARLTENTTNLGARMINLGQSLQQSSRGVDDWKTKANGLASTINAAADALEKTRGKEADATAGAVTHRAAIDAIGKSAKEVESLETSMWEAAVKEIAKANTELSQGLSTLSDANYGSFLAKFGPMALKATEDAQTWGLKTTDAIDSVAFAYASTLGDEALGHLRTETKKTADAWRKDTEKAAQSVKDATDKTSLDQLTAVHHFADELEKSSMSSTNYQILQNTRAHDVAIRDLQGVTNLSKQEYDRRKKIIDDYFTHEGKLITDSHKDWVDALSGLGNSLRQLAQTAGEGGLGKIAQALANIVGGMELATAAGINFKKALDTKDTEAKVVGVAGAVLQMAAAMSQATNTTNKLQAALGGAATGYSAGIGMGLSKTASGVLGAMLAIKSYFDAYEASGEEARQASESIRKAWLLMVGDAKAPNAATGSGLIQIDISEPAIGKGTQELINKLTRAGSAWADQIVDLQNKIHLGTISLDDYKFAVAQINVELDKFQSQLEGVGVAIQGVNARSAAFLSPFQKSLDDLAELKTNLASASGSEADALAATLTKQSGDLKAWAAGAQPEFDRLSVYIAGALGAGIAKGLSPMDLMKQLKPAYDVLKTGTSEMGLSSTPLAEKMLGVQATIDKAPVAFEALASVQQMWTGFNQANMMTKDLAFTMADDITEQFDRISASGGDMATAMALNQPVLQQMWEAQQKFGAYTDEGTLALLNQAETAGVVGENQRSVDQKILDVLTQIRDIFGGTDGVTAGANGFTSALEEAKAKAKGLHDEVAKIPTELDFTVTRTIYDDYTPDGEPAPGDHAGRMHLGGLVSALHQGAAIWPGGAAIARAHTGLLVGPAALAANEVPIIAQAGEGILSRGVGMPALAEWALTAMNQGRAPAPETTDSRPTVVTLHYYHGEMVDASGFETLMARKGVPAFTRSVQVDGYHNNEELASVLTALLAPRLAAKSG